MGINLRVAGKNIEVTEGLETAIQRKAEKLEKYISDSKTLDIDVVLKVEKDRQTIEISIPIKKTIVRAEKTTSDMYASIDVGFATIEKQIRKYKDKIVTRKQGSDVLRDSFLNEEVLPLGDSIAKTKKIEVEEMTPEDACIEMDLLGHNFYTFKNSNTKAINIVYKRSNGTNGLIEISE